MDEQDWEHMITQATAAVQLKFEKWIGRDLTGEEVDQLYNDMGQSFLAQKFKSTNFIRER